MIEGNGKDKEHLQAGGFVPNDKGLYPLEQTINGVKFEKAKEAGEFIVSEYKAGKKVVIEGFGYKAVMDFDKTNLKNRRDELQLVNSTSGILYKETFDIKGDPTQIGQVFRRLMTNVIYNGEVYAKNLKEVQDMLDKYTFMDLDAPFPKQEELDTKTARMKELEKEFTDSEMNATGGKNLDECAESKEVNEPMGEYVSGSVNEEPSQDDARTDEEPVQRHSPSGETKTELRGVGLEVNDIFNSPKRELKEGEFKLVERHFEQDKSWSFTGESKITSSADVAQLFKQLEDKAVENAFAVYHLKDLHALPICFSYL